MQAMSPARIGLSVPPQLPPADIPAYTRRAESVGFDELWLGVCGQRSVIDARGGRATDE
jgi:hypothetical protein